MTMRNIKNTLRRLSVLLISLAIFLTINPYNVMAQDGAEPESSVTSYTTLESYEGFICEQNEDSGYYVLVEDMAEILTYREEQQLATELRSISKYGSAAIVTLDQNDVGSSEDYAIYYSEFNFNKDSNTVFLIDMDNRNIWIYSYGYIGDEISSTDNNTITDNIYTYATNGDYYQCCSNEISQVYTLLKGGDIPRPMKHIGNAILAIILALILNYFLTMTMSTDFKDTNSQLEKFTEHKYELKDIKVKFRNTKKEYSPSSSDSSDSGGGSSDSGGGSSGGHGF